jgi:hypothetical protein
MDKRQLSVWPFRVCKDEGIDPVPRTVLVQRSKRGLNGSSDCPLTRPKQPLITAVNRRTAAPSVLLGGHLLSMLHPTRE